jgi:hypothetical protein
MKASIARYALLTPLIAFLLSRLWVAAFVYLGHWQHPYLKPIPGGWEGVPNWWLNPWTTYDSKHFLDIALHGYTAQTAPFFPFYSLLLRLAGNDPIVLTVWGIVLSNLSFLAALFLLFKLTQSQYDLRTARIVTWLTAFFPAAPYFSAVYTESLFLLCFVAALWGLQHKKWFLAACCGFLAAFTRSAGLLLFAGFLLQYGYDFFQSKRQQNAEAARPSLSQFVAIGAPLLGFVAAQLFIARQVGDATQSVASHQEYYRALTWPWLPILLDFWDLITQRTFILITLLNLGTTLLALILFWKYRKRQPISYSVMLLGLMLMQLTYSHYSIPRTQTSLRLLATSVPFLHPLALEMARASWPPFRRFLVIIMGLFLTALSAYIFGEKQFLG